MAIIIHKYVFAYKLFCDFESPLDLEQNESSHTYISEFYRTIVYYAQ